MRFLINVVAVSAVAGAIIAAMYLLMLAIGGFAFVVLLAAALVIGGFGGYMEERALDRQYREDMK